MNARVLHAHANGSNAPPASPTLPTINRDPAWCMMVLAGALEGLADMCQPELEEADEQLNLLHRSNLSALFTLLHDYADAARRALPEEIGGAT